LQKGEDVVATSQLVFGVALKVPFTMNGMSEKNNTHLYAARTNNNRVISSGFPIVNSIKSNVNECGLFLKFSSVKNIFYVFSTVTSLIFS